MMWHRHLYSMQLLSTCSAASGFRLQWFSSLMPGTHTAHVIVAQHPGVWRTVYGSRVIDTEHNQRISWNGCVQQCGTNTATLSYGASEQGVCSIAGTEVWWFSRALEPIVSPQLP